MKNLIVILTAILLVSRIGMAQEKMPLIDPQQPKYKTSLEKFYLERSTIRMSVTQVLEQELEANKYIVGPGDRFKVNIFGSMENEFDFQVLPEGTAIMPTVDEFYIGGLTLAEAKDVIKNHIGKYYRESKISVNLSGLRQFRVYITGEVKVPGTYFVQGSDRVSDVLETARGITDWADDTRIEIRHNDGEISELDLNQFYLEGDKLNNPYLNSGDLIYIPSIDVNKGYVIVESNAEIIRSLEVGSQDQRSSSFETSSGILGIYPLKKGEVLYKFLRRIGGLSKKSDLENILIFRNKESIPINLLGLDSNYTDFELYHRDKILIPQIIDKVYVQGEVATPGAYPYYANYKAKDYVGRAGVLESGADPEDYEIIRNKTGEHLFGGSVIIEKGDIVFVPKSGSEALKDFLVTFTPILSLVASLTILITSL